MALTRSTQRLVLYAAGGGGQLSPFLATAEADVTLARAEEVQRLLAADPLSWTAAEALSLVSFPRHYGQERFVTTWWGAPPEVQRRVAGRLLAFLRAVAAQGGLSRLGLSEADAALWGALAPEADAGLAGPFPGFDGLSAPGGAQRPDAIQAALPPYDVGERVTHPQFGQGIVAAVHSSSSARGREWYLTVDFPARGVVRLLGGIAPLRRGER